MKLPVIQSLWVGNPLSKLEQLCIQSFIDHGHEFHLYVYADVQNIPAGTVIKDANEILSADKIFHYSNGSLAGFSDWFRYEMLRKVGGFWVDMDVVCIKPFEFGDKLVVGRGTWHTADTAVIGGQHEVLNAVCNSCRDFPKSQPWDDEKTRRYKLKLRLLRRGRDKSKFGAVGGPMVLTNALKYFDLFDLCKPHTYFYPIHFLNWDSVFDETYAGGYVFNEHTHALHLWNEMLRKGGIDKNATFLHNSLIEQLKRKHGIK